MVVIITKIKKYKKLYFTILSLLLEALYLSILSVFNVFLNKSNNKSVETLCTRPNFLISYKEIYQSFKLKKV
jgi:hypothetical protein